MKEVQPQRVVVDLLRESALVVGGLVALHEVEDEFIWQLMRSLHVIGRRSLRRLARRRPARRADPQTMQVPARPHPAVEEFLNRLRSAAGR